jgi:hypothetical protein
VTHNIAVTVIMPDYAELLLAVDHLIQTRLKDATKDWTWCTDVVRTAPMGHEGAIEAAL